MKYFAFLEKELAKDDHNLDEYNGAKMLDDLRKLGDYH